MYYISLHTHTYTLTLAIDTNVQPFRKDQLHPFANPPADFELKPNDFDIDAEFLTADPNQSTGFVLRAKEDPNGICYDYHH